MPDVEKGSQSLRVQSPSPDVPHDEETLSRMSEDNTTSSSRCANDSRPYLTVFGAFLALFCSFGHMNSFGTYQSWYQAHQLHQLTPSTISWIGSLQLWVFFFSGAPIGYLFDKIGPTGLMATGTVVFTFAVTMTSISTQYYQYVLAQGILFGLGVGLLFYPSIASVSSHFSKYRATALGIAIAGTSVGGVVYPIILQHLFNTLGFGWGVRISGAISAVCCVVATLTVTSLPPTQKAAACVFNIKIFTDLRYILLAIGSSLVSFAYFIPLFYIVDYANHLSISPQTTFYVLAVMNGSGLFGRIAPAYLSDSIGRFNLLVPSAFLSGLACLVIWSFAKSLAIIMLFSAIYGFFSGAFISVLTPCVAQISEAHQFGTRIGMLYSIISIPTLVGGPVAGAILVQAHGAYEGMIVLSGATLIIGSFFILFSKLKTDRRLFARV